MPESRQGPFPGEGGLRAAERGEAIAIPRKVPSIRELSKVVEALGRKRGRPA